MKQIPKDFEIEEEISDFLKSFTMEYPSDQEIAQTIEVLRPYVPKKKKHLFDYLSQLKTLLSFSFNPGFILISLLAYIIGFCLIVYNSQSPYLLVFALSPLPFLFGLLELIKGREKRMWELEQSCKFSAQQLFLSKLTIISFINIFLNFLFSLLLSVSVPNIIFGKLTVFWIVPLCLVSSVSLFASIKIKGWMSVGMLPFLWVTVSIIMDIIPNTIDYLDSIHWSIYTCMTLISAAFLVCQTISIKRGIQFEINY